MHVREFARHLVCEVTYKIAQKLDGDHRSAPKAGARPECRLLYQRATRFAGFGSAELPLAAPHGTLSAAGSVRLPIMSFELVIAVLADWLPKFNHRFGDNRFGRPISGAHKVGADGG
jgi:hypothetical protein